MNASSGPCAFTSTFTSALLDLLYPPRCAACRELLASSADEPFCPTCRDAIDSVPPGCARCGLPGPHALCGACLAAPPAFASCRAGALFGGPLADAVHALKYGDRPALARPLGAWLAAAAPWPEGAAVVAVPLGRRRRLARGYDQAQLVARAVARARRAPFLPAALRRTRETAPQVGTSRAERLRNVRGAFAAERRLVAGRALVLVDDVVTTAATAGACSEALLVAGAREVHVIALARAD
ncbi:ComF family protein [Anaeromyxobacter diazotrophicus]|uniref:Amidophosphoribosyltransferase n=1 Tax=Anaeromyxobacter diazotrophicus TaxID=2590199 RepID=A0A7I9VT72_9BACT|nr:double zinc ribbon domain-containing protein [Anaeromyxobacter diazotrophicus]GEJ59501.1 amidophosphoribosyltransferase [Anaeromyxobacter diazotrophicus]